MNAVKKGDYITVTYEGKFSNGEVFDSSEDNGPLSFQIGTKSVLPGFEKGIMGMKPGETKTIRINPEDAYGPKLEELIQAFDRKSFGSSIDPKPGMALGIKIEKDGKMENVPAMVKTVKGDQVFMDFNHPLAGRNLIFEVTLTSISQSPPEDVDSADK